MHSNLTFICMHAGVLAVIAAIVCSVLLTVWLPIIYEYSEAHFYECPLEDTRALPDDATLELTTPFTGNSSSGRTSNSANAVCLSMQSATEYNLTWDASGPEFLQEWAFFTGDGNDSSVFYSFTASFAHLDRCCHNENIIMQ